jgi:hypothetical protein
MLQSQLRLGAPESAGRRSAAVGVHNGSTSACGLDGYPDLQLLGQGTDPISTLVVPTGSHSLVRLEPGATAWSALDWSTRAGAGEPQAGPCQPAAARLAVFAPHDRTELDVAFSAGPVCRFGRIEAGAFATKPPIA